MVPAALSYLDRRDAIRPFACLLHGDVIKLLVNVRFLYSIDKVHHLFLELAGSGQLMLLVLDFLSDPLILQSLLRVFIEVFRRYQFTQRHSVPGS